MRFLADMGISPSTTCRLREAGHDATHLRDEQLQRLPDQAVLAKAQSEQRVLLTADLDFGYLLAASRQSTPSVILFRLTDMRPEQVNRRLDAALSKSLPESGFFVVISDNSIRVRHLPIGKEA